MGAPSLGRRRAYVALSRRNAGSALALATQIATQRRPMSHRSAVSVVGGAVCSAKRFPRARDNVTIGPSLCHGPDFYAKSAEM